MNLIRDFRYAFRSALKNPVLGVLIVATLALCIGANTAIFSVIDQALLRPLPYPASDRLAQVTTFVHSPRGDSTRTSYDGRSWELLRDSVRLLDLAVLSSSSAAVNFAHGGNGALVRQQRVSSGFFRVLGITPLVGREFTEEEDRPGGAAVTVLSHELWTRLWQGDPSVVGRSVLLRGEPHVVVGVMPPGFRSTAEAALWTPLRADTTGEGRGTNFQIIGRLSERTSWEQADAEVGSVGQALFAELEIAPDVEARVGLVRLHEGLTQDVWSPLMILWASVGAVLLIGCVNVAGMLLAQGAGRSREIGTRVAIGGGPRTIFRQLLAESIVYALVGGAAGIVVGRLGLGLIRRLGAESFPFLGEVTLDARVAIATGGLSILACLLFGVFPAYRATRMDVRAALGGGARGSFGRNTSRPLRLMVAGQVALAVALLVAATLLIRTFAHLWELEAGFDISNVYTTTVSLQDARYQTVDNVNRFATQSVSGLAALPGVEGAAFCLSLPYQRGLNLPFQLAGEAEEILLTTLTYVTPEYFRVLQVPLLRGRALTDLDGATSGNVVVVNQAFVGEYLRDREPLGVELRMSDRFWRIVGVVGDVQQQPSWGTMAPLAPVPAAYIPLSQTNDAFLGLVHTWFSPNLIAKTAGEMPDLSRSVQDIVGGIDPLLPVAGFRALEQVKSRTLAFHRFMMTMLVAFASIATVLSCVGIYGVVSNSVAARGRELCIRMAVGATVADAFLVAVRPAVVLASTGALAGTILAVVGAGMIEHLLWGVRATDPVTLAGVAMGAVVLAAFASGVPATRIVALKPAAKLRED